MLFILFNPTLILHALIILPKVNISEMKIALTLQEVTDLSTVLGIIMKLEIMAVIFISVGFLILAQALLKSKNALSSTVMHLVIPAQAELWLSVFLLLLFLIPFFMIASVDTQIIRKAEEY